MSRWTVSDDATVEAHEDAISAHSESYIAAALDPSRPRQTRARALAAAMATLAKQASRCGAAATQQASQMPAPSANIASVVASAMDAALPVAALVRAAEVAAEAMVQPVLEKALCLLARVESVGGRGGAGVEGSDGEGQETGEDEEDGDEESEGGGKEEGEEEGGLDGSGGENRRGEKRKKKQGGGKMLKKLRGTSGFGGAQEKAKRGSAAKGSGQYFVDMFMMRLASPSASVGREDGVARREDDVFVAKTARELPMSKDAVQGVLDSLLGRLALCDVFEMPAFIYQLLLLVSGKGTAVAKRNVLRAVVMRFADLETQVRDAAREASQAQGASEDDVILSRHLTEATLRQIQSTTLLHLDFAVKQDPGLVSELTKLAKAPPDSPHSIMVPFGMAILLALSRTPAVQLSVMTTIRDAIIRFDKELRVRVGNPFAAQLCRDDPPMRNPRDALLSTVLSTPRDGWDLVSEPLLHLALHLMDKCTAQWSPTLSRSEADHKSEAELGADILVELFEMHAPLRGEIVDQLVSRVILREKSGALALDALGRLARESASYLLKQAPKIKESIADLVTLPPWTSCALIAAYKPLLQARPDLRDYLFLALRKALFHRGASARAVASTGFLCLMTGLDSHGSDIASSSLPSNMSADAMEEALQPLRRALSHPPAIRALMYKEMRRMVSATRKGAERSLLCQALHDLLLPHLLEYIDASTSPFVLLERCVNESAGGQLVEPLGDLIACLTELELANDEKNFAKGNIVLLANYMASVSVKDFDISKDTRHAGVGGEAEDERNENEDEESRAVAAAETANRNRARVLGGTVEALVNAVLSMPSSLHSAKLYTDTVFPLLHIREDVLGILKTLGAVTAADALRDLGGSVDIEPGAGRSIGWFGGNGRGGTGSAKAGAKGKGAGKKAGGKKSKGGGDGDEEGRNSSVSIGDIGGRFGAFGILVSSSSSPVVSLGTAVDCLASMLPAEARKNRPASIRGEPRAIAEWFTEHSNSKDVSGLSSFLRAAAKTHVDAAIDAASGRSSTQAIAMNQTERKAFSSSLCALVHIAMSDFQLQRSQTGPVHTKNSIRSLELVETCISAVRRVYAADPDVATELCKTFVPGGNRARDDVTFEPPAGSAVLRAIECLEKTVESLLEDGMLLEADVVVRILASLRELFRDGFCCDKDGVDKFISLSESMGTWVERVVGTRPEGEWETSVQFVKRLFAMMMDQSHARKGLESAESVAKRIHVVLGEVAKDGIDGEGSQASNSSDDDGPLALIHSGSVLQSVDAVLECINRAMDDVEWCFRRTAALELAVLGSKTETGVSHGSACLDSSSEIARCEKIERQWCKAEDQGQRRLVQVMSILVHLLRTAIGKSSHQESLLKVTLRCYKSLSSAVGAQLRRSGEPRTSFMEMVNVAKDVGPALWDYTIIFDHTCGGDGDGRKNRGSKSAASSVAVMAAKEARLVPQLVYENEKFEKALISVAKKVKANLLVGLARNHARDVRIEVNEDSDESAGNHSDDNEGHHLSVDNLLNRGG